MEFCINCGKRATHKHHIIPKSLGGTDKFSNLVYLCDECHGKIHGVEYKNGQLSHSELTKIGLKKAKAAGKRIGTQQGDKLITSKSIYHKNKMIQYLKDFNGMLSNDEYMRLFPISRNTFFKYKKELKEVFDLKET